MNLINKEKINRTLNSQMADDRIARVFNSFQNVLFTSSFGITSAVLFAYYKPYSAEMSGLFY